MRFGSILLSLIMIGRLVYSSVALRLRQQRRLTPLRLGGAVAPSFFSTDAKPTLDLMRCSLSSSQGIMVRAVSVKELVQTYMDRLPLSDDAGRILGETTACTALLASSLKGEETLQVNFVGNGGLKSVTVISDSDLNLRGKVGNPSFAAQGDASSIASVLGDVGQFQVIRNHPSFKAPMSSVVGLVDGSVALNFAVFLADSEQRNAAIIADVSVRNKQCQHATAVLVERLPGADDSEIEKAIENLQRIQQRGLATYVKPSADRAMLDALLDDCLAGLEDDNSRWSKSLQFSCSCSRHRVLGALRLLSAKDREEIVAEQKPVEVNPFSPSVYLTLSLMIVTVLFDFLVRCLCRCLASSVGRSTSSPSTKSKHCSRRLRLGHGRTVHVVSLPSVVIVQSATLFLFPHTYPLRRIAREPFPRYAVS